MDLENYYEVDRVAEFIHTNSFTRVALQFPDDLLKDSSKVLRALRQKLQQLHFDSDGSNLAKLYVMADTTYGSCCVDEVGAAHVKADCVIHYGHSCLSPTTTIPAFCVFGKAPVQASNCAEKIVKQAVKSNKPVLVLYGLEYAHSIADIKQALSVGASSVLFANLRSSIVNPLASKKQKDDRLGVSNNQDRKDDYSIGGLYWSLPEGHKMEDYLLFWIGSDNSAFTNVILTFNSSETVRYDATEDCLMADAMQQSKILKRRYYLVEKAKDANMVGILVGTLGVAGYLDMIHQMTDLVTRAEKKAYTLVMGRPNPAKLANFPECDVFIYVSCAQTALLDSKEFLAPIITPFEAMLAFNRGSQWTGAYQMEFQNLIASCPVEASQAPEARFSFLQGGYVEDYDLRAEDDEETDAVRSLVNITEKALQLQNKDTQLSHGKNARSGAEFFVGRSFQGLEIHGNESSPQPFLMGRTGKASGYKGEQN